MKKIFAIAALGALSLTAETARAFSWTVECVKQGPARGFDARSLKPGNVARPTRVLSPTAGMPASAVGYPDRARSIPGKAAVAENSDASGQMNFFSLGFGGQIILRTSELIINGPGADVNLFETTWGNPSCRPNNSEQAYVEFSADGVNWVPGISGTLVNGPGGQYNTCYNGKFDLGVLFYATYVRITDRTNPAWNVSGDGNDAYDVDGLTANYTYVCTPEFPFPPPPGYVQCGYEQGVASQFVGAAGNFPGRGIVGARKNFANANINEPGFPWAAFTNPGLRDSGPNAGAYNFWSLGFGGWACFYIGYPVYDGPGADFYCFETTWNNAPCPNYPEKANVSVSADGVNWSQPIMICKDALGIPGTSPAIDLAAFGPGYSVVNFIKFVDATNPADFGGGADAYDIDNIAILQPPPPPPCMPNPNFSCSNIVNVRQAFPLGASTFMEGGVPEEMFALDLVGASMVSDKVRFMATIAEEGGYKYSIRSSTGQEIISGDLKGDLYSTPTEEVGVSHLNNGVYFLTLTSANSKETVKFVKQ